MSIKNKVYALLRKDTFEQCLEKGSLYRLKNSESKIRLFQVEQFNKVWQDAFTNFEIYKHWKTCYSLPEKIESLDELINWPILTKYDLQKNTASLLRKDSKPDSFLQTGGSTGEPLRLPIWKDKVSGPNMWMGRKTYGINPGSKTFLIWGHHHLYGKGLKRRINIGFRDLKDKVSNIQRVSAYDLSPKQMQNAFEAYLNFSPDFLIGFSASILNFVRINALQQEKVKKTPKAILCTAGPLSKDEKNQIEEFFRAPVCMEYGSVECGVMAYTNPDNSEYNVFWDTHLLQGSLDNYNEVKNIVTRLTPTYFPLIRYDIGDYLDISKQERKDSILNIEYVKGRPSDMVRLPDGTSFFGALIGDCVKQVPCVLANQLIVEKDKLKILLTASSNITNSHFDLIKSRLLTVVPGLKNFRIEIEQAKQLNTTVGGKTPLVIRKKIS